MLRRSLWLHAHSVERKPGVIRRISHGQWMTRGVVTQIYNISHILPRISILNFILSSLTLEKTIWTLKNQLWCHDIWYFMTTSYFLLLWYNGCTEGRDRRARVLFGSTMERRHGFVFFPWRKQMAFPRRSESWERREVWDPYLPVHKRKHNSQSEQAQHRSPTHAMDAEGSL